MMEASPDVRFMTMETVFLKICEVAMYRFVEKPHLPKGKVRLVMIGKAYQDMLCLERYGITSVGVEKSDELELPVASHVDMQAIHLYRDKILSAPVENCKGNKHYMSCFDELRCKVKKLVYDKVKMLSGCSPLIASYPGCAAYNVLLLDKMAIFNQKCIDIGLKNVLFDLGYRPVYIKQGFARCSVCVVREDAVITADTGIAAALRMESVDVLLIRPGFISLPGYDTGFLGGASFKIADNMLAFTGRLDGHPDGDQIFTFLEKYGVCAVTLSKQPIFDIGSAIPLIEEV